MLRYMRFKGPLGLAGLLCITCLHLPAADTPPCTSGARAWLPCEMRFAADAKTIASTYTGDVLSIEFRSPTHATNLVRAFSDGGPELVVRFTPSQPGVWTYHITSSIPKYSEQESTFTAAETDLPGFVSVANLRHWWTTNKRPHLWLSAEVPFFALDQSAYEAWLDARKHDGFTHIRGVLLDTSAKLKALTDGAPNPAYFRELDAKLLAAAQRGFVLDLIFADRGVAASGVLHDYATRGPLLRYLVARYGALDVTWQGIPQFENVTGSRQLLKQMYEDVARLDTFNHPRSTDARDTSSSLLPDSWMNFLIESSPKPALGAVEHQFTTQPEIHVITTSAPDTFRHELWNATTNGEYISINYAALQNAANVKAVQTWASVMADTRHWELEPYFDVDGARAVGLTEVEYLAYAENPGIVEITLPKHKYNPVWVNPITGEEVPLKDYKGEVFSRETPDKNHDWILQVPREGHKESMLRSYRFESVDPPIQEPELDPAKTPFEIADPSGDELNSKIPILYAVKLTRSNRATRNMQYLWWGEVVAGGEGARVLAAGAGGTFQVPEALAQPGANLNLRVLAINANGKAYEVDRVYRLTQ
jgi:Domain of unknown function (DUF5060)/Protein of unknown function (DUF4038)